MIGQLWQLLLIWRHVARAESNKNVEHMKPSYTALFDVLTRETIFHEVGGSGQIAVFEKMLTGSTLVHLFPPFSARSRFLCPFTFFARPHWLRAWHRQPPDTFRAYPATMQRLMIFILLLNYYFLILQLVSAVIFDMLLLSLWIKTKEKTGKKMSYRVIPEWNNFI